MNFLDEPTRLATVAASIVALIALVGYVLFSFSERFAGPRRSFAWLFFICGCVVAVRAVYLGLGWVMPAPEADPDQFGIWLMGAGVILLIGAALFLVERIRAFIGKRLSRQASA